MRSRRFLGALFEALLHFVAGQRWLEVVRLFVFGAAESRQHDALAVESDLQVVFQLQAADDVDGLAIETRADDVLPIDREVVANHYAAACADRKTGHGIGWGEIPPP